MAAFSRYGRRKIDEVGLIKKNCIGCFFMIR